MQDEVFTAPELELRTRVYKSVDPQGKAKYHSSAGDNREEVLFIENGSITNLEAFLEFLKLIYMSILSDASRKRPAAFETVLSNIPMLLVTHHTWSQFQMEKITQFLFEALQLNNVMLLPVSLASTYAMGSLQNCCVIDVGTNHTDIIPIIDYTPLDPLTSSIPFGGQLINETLSKLLPDFTPNQIECLKRSPIYEVLSDDAKKLSAFDFQDNAEADDGTLDVAAIVTSGRDTREILEERERKKKEQNASNSQLESNSFIDNDGNKLDVGKQRFQGCERLIEKISIRVGRALEQVDDVIKLRSAYENIIIVGGATSIQGFKEALLGRLINDQIIIEPDSERQAREQSALGTSNSKKKNKFMGSTFIPSIEYVQAPNVIKIAKYPEYFPEWKKHGYADIAFLGSQIVSKQIFTHSKDTFYITREKYDEKGPACIWDTMF